MMIFENYNIPIYSQFKNLSTKAVDKFVYILRLK